jgi:hypothetical protein
VHGNKENTLGSLYYEDKKNSKKKADTDTFFAHNYPSKQPRNAQWGLNFHGSVEAVDCYIHRVRYDMAVECVSS